MRTTGLFRFALAALLGFQLSSFAIAQETPPSRDAPSPPASSAFDGKWTVLLDCPNHDDGKGDFAKGYRQSFPAEINGGELRGTHAIEGQPGWHLLTGKIAPDGKATLRLDGIVSSPRNAINDAGRGKPYTYRVRAQFAPDSGTGQRLGQRKCDFTFKRQ